MFSTLSSQIRQKLRKLNKYLFPAHTKEEHELGYWQHRKDKEGTLTNKHYEYFFTTFFDLTHDFYSGKKVLDIGCGPRGSLEWAHMTAERVGLDPLVRKYQSLGIDTHHMRYVDAPSEKIPFPAGYFDVVTTLNSLDHVDNINNTIIEIGRVLKPGGILLVIVEVNHPPTNTEPITLSWDVPALFETFADLQNQRRFEIGNHDIYGQLKQNAIFDESAGMNRPGIFVGQFKRR